MFFNSFMPKPTFGSSGSRKSGGGRRSRADKKGAAAVFSAPKPVYKPKPKPKPKPKSSTSTRKGASASMSRLVPKSSPVPKIRPKTIGSETTSHKGPNLDGSAGYTRTTSYNSKGKVGSSKIKTSNGDSVTANGKAGMKIGNTIYNTSTVNAPTPTKKLNDANGVGRRKAPVNVDSDKSSGGSAAGSTGGSSGKIKASKAQEDNLTVKRKSRGTSKYKLATNNPLVVSRKKRNS